ncbi:MAG: radical SAM/SPASM domain-containing protein [Aquifex sp.]|nr:MAG: radical SAM/SPASM domain-containing protein [Aquifex sp.]
MLRITQYIKSSLKGRVLKPLNGVILIWNLTNRCNLYCKHCYAWANSEKEELSFEEVKEVIEELPANGVRFAILSGGEPLLREDIYEVSELLRKRGIKTYLSTNGLLINSENIRDIKKYFDYVGISIDGDPEVHDKFRGKEGSFKESLKAIELSLSEGIRTGLRFTLTKLTRSSLPYVFKLVEEVGIPKIYISHLVYSGRGQKLTVAQKEEYRKDVEFIMKKSFDYVEKGKGIEVVTGNNEADAVILYKEFKKRYPEKADVLYETLRNWGGNQAGVRLVNIDHKGNVKPDPFFFHSLGNLRGRRFTEIWNSNGLLSKLREKPRKIKGKCKDCPYLDICNGNSRARAYFSFGDYFAEDPLCYI